MDYQRLWTESLPRLSKSDQFNLVRHLCRTDLFFLLAYVCGRVDMRNEWLLARCRDVQEQPNSMLDLWAREHYKSTIITFGKTIQDVLASHGEEPIMPEPLTFGIFSHSKSIAKDFLRQIKRELESNRLLLELFPDILYANPYKDAASWSIDNGLMLQRSNNKKEATIEAHGVVEGQPIGKHFDILIYDDVVSPEYVNTPEMIEKTTSMLELSYNLGVEGGKRRFIGTRYHFFDSYKVIMERGSATPRLHPAREGGKEDGRPVFLSDDSLKEKRRDQGIYTFGCQMLLNPKADASQGFQEKWLRYYDNVDTSKLNVYILVDPANKKRKKSDYTVIWTVGIGEDGKIRILDIVRDKLSLTERTRKLFELVRKYQPIEVRYEEYGMQADIEHIQTQMELEAYEFDITPVGGTIAKDDRIKMLVPKFENGEILLPRSCHYTDFEGATRDLIQVFVEQEYKPFPVMKHDDMLDALARAYEPKRKMILPNKKQPQKRTHRRTSGSWMG